jgi:peptidoglycan glycosyltransferase
MDRRIRRTGIVLVVLFGLLFMQLAYVQLFAANRIKNDPANATRQIIAEYGVERGPILTWDGHVMAQSLPSADESSDLRFQRDYPDGPLYAGLTGYYSRVYGRSDLEQSMNDYLSGDAPELAISTLTDLVLGRTRKGGAVVTTVSSSLQQVAQDALGDLPGAVVAVEPETGSVMALVANPSYDPSVLSSGTTSEITSAWNDLTTAQDQPMLSVAKDRLFLPGSTGKLVTAAAALENGWGPDKLWPNPHELDLPLTSSTVQNFGNLYCNGGSKQVTMAQAFKESCNVTFAEIALALGAKAMSDRAYAFAFCPTDPPTHVSCADPPIPFTASFQNGRFPVPSYFKDNEPLLAYSGIGLDNVLSNPLHMALISSAIANRGTMVEPRLVCEARDPQGRVIRRFPTNEFGQPLSVASSQALTNMMLGVTQGGTASSAFAGSAWPVAGKTGTATNGPDRNPNAWFTGFAPAGRDERPRIAVAVIVLDGGSLGSEATGGRVAAPIARQVIDAYLAAPQRPCVT